MTDDELFQLQLRQTSLVMLILAKPLLRKDGGARVMNESYSDVVKKTGVVIMTEMLEYSVMVN